MPVVSAGAAGQAGAQAERAGARGKSAAFFSFSFFLLLFLSFFFTKWDFARLRRGWGIYKGANVASISFFSLLFLSPIGKRARSASSKLSQFFSGRLQSGRWRASREDDFAAGRGRRDTWAEEQKPPPASRGPDRRARGRVGAGWPRRQRLQVSGGRAACSAALPPRRGVVAFARPGPHEAGAVPGRGRERAWPGQVPEAAPALYPRS